LFRYRDLRILSGVELGGHIELLAVFPDETVTLLREPEPAR